MPSGQVCPPFACWLLRARKGSRSAIRCRTQQRGELEGEQRQGEERRGLGQQIAPQNRAQTQGGVRFNLFARCGHGFRTVLHNRYPGVTANLPACRLCPFGYPRRQQQQSDGCSHTYCSLPWPLLVASHASLADVQRGQGCSTAACCNVLDASKPPTTAAAAGRWRGLGDCPHTRGLLPQRLRGHNRGRTAGDTRTRLSFDTATTVVC